MISFSTERQWGIVCLFHSFRYPSCYHVTDFQNVCKHTSPSHFDKKKYETIGGGGNTLNKLRQIPLISGQNNVLQKSWNMEMRMMGEMRKILHVKVYIHSFKNLCLHGISFTL